MIEQEHSLEIYIPKSLIGIVDVIVQHQSSNSANLLCLPNAKVEVFFFLEGSKLDHFHINSSVSNFLPNDSNNFAVAFSSQTHPIKAKFKKLNAISAVMNPIAAKAIMDTPAWTIKDLHMEPTMFKSLNQIQDSLNTLPTFKQRALFIEKFIYKRLLGSKYLNETLEKIKSLNTLYADINSLFHETQLNFSRYHYSRSHFNRICKDWLGVSYNEYLIHKKFRKAMYIISHSNKSLTEIAYELDFYDQAHFTRIFKRFAGINPSAYRKSNKGVVPEMILLK